MAMTILNNAGVRMSLGELNKNITQVGKQLAKIASGQRIVGARDGVSDFAISEKMRVKLRVGGQNDINVKTGHSMLQVAEGGIQEQIRLMRSIKAKALDACNDTNTDADREVIQKEIDQYYRQIQDIATDTEYNGMKLLMGGDFRMETAYYWRRVPSSEVTDDGEMNIIPDNYDVLDGVNGPFDAFVEWNGNEPSTIASLGLQTTQNLVGGTDGTPRTIEMNLNAYGSVTALDGIGFTVGGRNYVFTSSPGGNYRSPVTEISIVGCSSLNDAVNRAVRAVNGDSYQNVVTAENQEGNLLFTVGENSPAANNQTATGLSLTGGTETIPAVPSREAVGGTGLSGIPASLSGGRNASGSPAVPGDPDSQDTYVPPARATMSVSVLDARSGTGFTIHDRYGYTYCIQFSEDNNAGLTLTETRGRTYYYTVGKNATASFSRGDINFGLSGGTMTLSARNVGTSGNSNHVTDGIVAVPGTPEQRVTYTPVDPFNDVYVRTLTDWADDGERAYYEIDLENYISSDSSRLESFIGNMVDKTITFTDWARSSNSSYYYTHKYTFVDSANDLPLDPRANVNLGTRIDLNELRNRVNGTTTIAEAFAGLMQERVGTNNFEVMTSDASDAGIVNRVRFVASVTGTIGNNDRLNVTTAGGLRHYDIDYGSYFASNPVENLPEFLDGKGFRFYCATHEGQWFNMEFINAAGIGADRPISGTEDEDIKTIVVDVSNVTDASSLVQAIYDQATPILAGDDPNFNHYMRVGGNVQTGVLRLYDWRTYNVNTPQYDYQERGAKISDGVADNIVLMSRDLYVKDLVIQHTDKQNMNIHVKIPRTTIDHILGFDPAEYSVSDFNVTSKEMRENLIGTKMTPGLLDRGIQYLLDANTLIGSQINRLDYAGENIITQNENLTSSESTIRDADMAQEMLAYTKYNILSQGAQGMLAQANQTTSSVLSLLQ